VLESLKTTRGRVGLAFLTSLVIVVPAVLLRFPLAIVPALLVAPWVPVFASREPVSPPARQLMLVLTGGLAMLAGGGALIFVLVQT
jgi:hypothetical protein